MASLNGTSTTHHEYPQFPKDLTAAPLISISLAKLEVDDESESGAFFKASKELGFFYLNLQDSSIGTEIVDGAEKLKKIQQEFYKRPQHEKEQYAREKIHPFFGYRQAKLPLTNEDGTQKLIETYNLRKDDFIGSRTALPCHPLITENWAVFQSYVKACRRVIEMLIMHLERHLKLDKGALAQLHRFHEHSGDHVRFNRAPVMPYSEETAKAGEHTDFGSLTILMNWLGGLQIRRPETNEWVYVRPIPGSAVVNLGDALVKFTAGLLRSNVHRVVPPPPPQHQVVRDSLVYFARPEDKVLLKRLKGGLIDRQPETQAERDEPDMTADEWILRRSVGDLQGVYTVKGGLESRS